MGADFMSVYFVPLVLAVSSLPAFIAAALIARGRPAGGRWPLASRVMAMVGLSILAGALGLLWAGENETRRLAVIIAMAVAVNGLGVVLLFGLARRNGNRPS